MLALGALALLLGIVRSVPSHESDPSLARLGKVRFAVSCNAAAQKEFEVAMAYYHSFAWPQLKASLERVIQADPACGMAHWGRALGYLDNPFLWPGSLSPKVLADGQAAIDAARAAGLKTQRERDYVEALAVFFKDADKLNHRTRAKAFEDAQQAVAARYPEDTEATILYALVLSANFDPTDKKYTNQLRAAKILEPIFQKQPDHPGVAHYLIHSYDYPPIAAQGLDAARRYAKIAPDATHAQHMPSHIFTRVGPLDASRWTRIASRPRWTATRPSTARTPTTTWCTRMLQLGQDRAAEQVIAHARGVAAKPDHVAAAYAYAAMPARLALERGAWQEAARLSLEPAAEAYPVEEVSRSRRRSMPLPAGVGAAMSGDASGGPGRGRRACRHCAMWRPA